MHALVLEEISRLNWRQWPDPVLDDDSRVLVRISAVGICGSDLQGFLGVTGRRIPPMVMGHEMSGIVVETRGALSVQPGQQVVVLPFINCGSCVFCRSGRTNFCKSVRRYCGILKDDGGMAEYIAVPESQVVAIPESVDPVLAALAEPLAVASSGASKLHTSDFSSPVMIIGAGTIGLLALQSMSNRGYCNIHMCDTNHRRLLKAQTLGAVSGFDPTDPHVDDIVLETTGGHGFTGVLDAAGVGSSYAFGVAHASIGGTVVWIGNSGKTITLAIPQVIMREITIAGSFIYTNEGIRSAISQIVDGSMDLKPIIELVAPLSQGVSVFNSLAVQKVDIIKAVLTNTL